MSTSEVYNKLNLHIFGQMEKKSPIFIWRISNVMWLLMYGGGGQKSTTRMLSTISYHNILNHEMLFVWKSGFLVIPFFVITIPPCYRGAVHLF